MSRIARYVCFQNQVRSFRWSLKALLIEFYAAVGDSVLSWNREDNFGQMLEWISKASESDVSRMTVARTGGSGFGVFTSQEIAVDEGKCLLQRLS